MLDSAPPVSKTWLEATLNGALLPVVGQQGVALTSAAAAGLAAVVSLAALRRRRCGMVRGPERVLATGACLGAGLPPP